METNKMPKTVAEELEELETRTDKLEKEIEKAEQKHPPKIDHAEDGGVI